MNQWGWALASAILVITLVQLVAFYYLMRDDNDRSLWPSSSSSHSEGPETRPPRGVGNVETDDVGREVSDDRLKNAEEVCRCSRCGAPNENHSMIRFCYNCGAEL